jgi:small neutral amino acid transporter SnatA (MarC family)
LGFFNVGLDDFRIAGGLLALLIAFEMFQAQYGTFVQPTHSATGEEVDVHGLAITPFAFPLLVGPAELSIIITLSNDNPGWIAKALLGAACLIATFLNRPDPLVSRRYPTVLGQDRHQCHDPGNGTDRRRHRGQLHHDRNSKRVARFGRSLSDS